MICDAVFDGDRPTDPALGGKVALRVAAALAVATDEEAASFFYDLVMKVPERLWAGDFDNRLRAALHANEARLSRTRPPDRSATIAQLLKRRLDRQRAS